MARSSLCVLMVCVALILIVADAQPRAKMVKCHDKKGFPLCGNQKFYCPETCPRSCFVDCELCRAQFALATSLVVCARTLVLLAEMVSRSTFMRNPSMTRDFTWVQSIAILFGDHRLYIGAQKTASWDDTVDRLIISYDGETIDLPTIESASWQSSDSLPALTIYRSTATNAIIVEVEKKFKITANVVPITDEESRVHNYGITDEDRYAHLELGFKIFSLNQDVHGVLGQTYREGYISRVKISSNMPLMVGEHKFSTSGLFAADCAVSRFGRVGNIAMMSELASVNCASGVSGKGIVCKK